MDVIVAEVPFGYGMLLSQSWGDWLGGTLHIYISYATIPILGGKARWLYRETKLSYAISYPK